MLEPIAQRAEIIFQELGGIREARKILSDSQIVDVTLFNGLTATVFPFYSNFDSEDVEGYAYINLYDAEYIDDTSVSVYDYNYNLLYRCIPTFMNLNNVDSYYFGVSEEDKQFLQSVKHGSVCFLKYETNVSPQLMQIIVSHKLPSTVYKDSSKSWLSSINNQMTLRNTVNELILKLPSTDNVYIYTLKGGIISNYNSDEITYNPNSEYNIYQANEYAYINLETSLWLTIREYRNSNTVYNDLINRSLTYVTDYLTNLSYERLLLRNLANYNNTYIFTKSITDGYVEEITVALDDYMLVKTIEAKEFKPLTVTSLAGEKVESIRVNENNTLHVSLNDNVQSITDVNYQSSVIRRAHLDSKSTSYALSIKPVRCTGVIVNA